MDQITAAPETHDSRPPVVVESAPNSGAAAKPLRTTATQRAIIRPLPWESTNPELTTYPTNHPYIRLYWTATIGPGAVADMMRLATAATRGRSLRRPTHLHVLVRANLVHVRAGHIYVRTRIPRLNNIQIRLLPPDLRRQHPETPGSPST
ncbi:MAG: hypothetical protein GY926_08440 [bacterium]|nr:hypothetical protein [bacterium]MCP4965252.1 hypothetical protein [bacterium]